MKKNLVEIWGDLVSLKDLWMAILLCSISTMGCYFLAPQQDATRQLFYGLGGAVLGFLISSFLIKPKRIVTDKEDSKQ